MRLNFLIDLQSFSDIITNSSSELFCIIYGTDKIKKLLESTFKEWDNNDKWYWGGEACGCEIQTIRELYDNIENDYDNIQYIEYFSDKWEIFDIKTIKEKLHEHIQYDNHGAYINLKELTFEQYIEFSSLYDQVNYTKNSIIFRIDYGNKKFIEYLNSLGIETILID